MTREQLAAVKANAERATATIVLIETLEAAKKANLSLAVKPLTCWDTGNELLSKDLALRVMKLGIDTLITQLESELAGIPVTEAECGTDKYPIAHPRGNPLVDLAGETCFTIPATLAEAAQ